MDKNGNVTTIKRVHSLEAELIRLRESTKDALEQSWEEVEALQAQCTAHIDIANQLENDIIEAKRKEEYWHRRCLETESKLLQSGGGVGTVVVVGGNSTTETGSTRPNAQSTEQTTSKGRNFNPLRMPWFSNNDSDSIFQSTTTDGGGHNYNPAELENIYQLEQKIKDREEAIYSLEQTVNQHVKTMQGMQAEMYCMMETQRIKERKSQVLFRKQVSFLESQMNDMQNKLEKKEDYIASQKKRTKEYKAYIQELASELEVAMGLVQRSQQSSSSYNPNEASTTLSEYR